MSEMFPAKIPGIVKKLFRSMAWHIPGHEKSIYLTFDDGPTPEVTDEVLRLLSLYQAHATFFCLGRNVDRHPELYRKIVDHGHKTGNHTYSHLQGWKTANSEYFNDIELARTLIPSDLFRPPYGKIRRSQRKHLQNRYKMIMWDVMSFDYSRKVSKQQCRDIVLKHTRPGSIVVFHDSVKAGENVLFALENTLHYFTEKGFVFKSVRL